VKKEKGQAGTLETSFEEEGLAEKPAKKRERRQKEGSEGTLEVFGRFFENVGGQRRKKGSRPRPDEVGRLGCR